ncbi:MAG: hypothetical protein WDO15_22055 [Bacteroidota bacterium]
MFYLYPAWGSDTAGTWKDDLYTMEVVFMDTLLVTVPFPALVKLTKKEQFSMITDSEAILKATRFARVSTRTQQEISMMFCSRVLQSSIH